MYQSSSGSTPSEGHSVGVMWRDAAWVSLIRESKGLENGRAQAHISVMEKSIALTVVAAIVVFAGAYAFSVSKSQGKGK